MSIPDPFEPWKGEIETAERPAALERLVGKTIARTSFEGGATEQECSFEFTDGTTLVLRSWDYEGYSSGFYLHILGEEGR